MYVDGTYESCCKGIDELMKCVEQGDPESLYLIGKRLDEGDGLNQDRETGIAYLKSSAEKGYAPAQNYIGYLYFNGDYLPHDEHTAFEWFSKAANQGLPKAEYNLALMYEKGEGGLEKDQSIFLKLIRRSAEGGYPASQCTLGDAYYFGRGVDKDYVQAVHWHMKAAEQCDPDSQYFIGFAYEHGQGVARNIEEAVKWYRVSAQKGHPKALFRLGVVQFYKCIDCEEEGISALKKASDKGYARSCFYLFSIYSNIDDWKDYTEARYWLLKGISSGSIDCIKEAAKEYLSGHILPYNPELAVKCYEKGVDWDDVECIYLLGDMYDQGKYVVKDIDKALGMFRKAADRGECRAQNRLAEYYRFGGGNDPSLALYWYRLAACNGNVSAMIELGRIYEEGEMVTQSLTRASCWYNKAYMKNDEIAKDYLDSILARYDPFEVEKAEGPIEMSMRLAVEDDDADECFNLGNMYFEGLNGLPMDLEKSRLWFDLGSDYGHAGCIDKLGTIYYYGNGIDIDYSKAEDCFRRAAEKGSPFSQMMLGFMIINGQASVSDIIEAKRLLKRSSMQGFKDRIIELLKDSDYQGDLLFE